MADYIPPELIPNILARLPVYDVLRCTSVCKSWYSLITSTSFVSSHLNLSSPNQEPRLLIRYYKSVISGTSHCLHRDNQTFDEIAKFDPPFNRGWDIIDTINGLFCFYRSGSIVLWNPSLRKSLILPKSRVLYHHSLGFGFVATSNEYKIVKISFASNKQLQAEVYRLSTGSWSDVKLEDSLNVVYKPVHLNGILHWSAFNPDKFKNYICSFDLKLEKFSSLMVPSCLRHVVGLSFYPSAFRESLSLIDKTHYGFCSIWVMKEYGVSDSWQNLIVISSQLLDLSSVCYFRHDGEILCEISGNPKLVSYDCKDKRVTNIELLADCLVTSVHTYVESLTLINISNVVPENIQGFSDLLLN